MVFHWSLSDSKSPQVSRAFLSILAVLNNAVVWMVSTRPPTSKSSRPFNDAFVAVPKAPIIIGIIVTFIIIIIIIIIIIYSLDIFTSTNVDGRSLEFEWQQISSSLQDSSQYSGRSHKFCSLDRLHSFSNFQVLQAL